MSEPNHLYHQALSSNRKLLAENTRLKAEVERLRASSFVTAVSVEQYERVVKAGDALMHLVEFPADWEGEENKEWWAAEIDAVNRWNAAKEGKPSV